MSIKYKKTKDVVALTGLSRETLKFYENKSLVKPAGRTAAGYRLKSYVLDSQSWENDPECASLLAVISSPA